ncbi:hypothetical protein PBRA_009523 [Plasmodiophora brassicae]|uniref:Cilia- and flagella-associated protein 157 n=1 Tax=Plasmodiophora brassicae TaxID=37360 RepID=A0A0G4J8I6_PLABS|nr:hypothetical protein PBRA_009523 [Plasmodiophora brassicae]
MSARRGGMAMPDAPATSAGDDRRRSMTAASRNEMDVFRDQQVFFLKNALDEQRRRAQRHAAEADALRHEAKVRETGNLDMVDFLQKRIKDVERQNEDIARKLDEFLANEADHIASIDSIAQGKIASVQADAHRQVAELRVKYDECQAELNTLKAFREEKTALERDLDDVRRAADQREAQLLRQADQVERDHRAEIVKIRQACASEISAAHSASRRLAESDLTLESKRLRVDNARFQSELYFHEQQTARLVKENEALHGKVKVALHAEQARQLELAAGKERHYAERGAQQQRRIRELLRKVDSVEHDLVQATQAGQASVVEVEQAASAELAACRIETAECRAALDVKTRELQHMRVLARAILSQRTQTERFFHEALEQVRAERQGRQDVQQHGPDDAKGDKTAPMRRRRQNENLDDVDLDERERILRLLFAKMNLSTVLRGPPEELAPEHSFHVQRDTRLPPPYSPAAFQFVTTLDDDKLE